MFRIGGIILYSPATSQQYAIHYAIFGGISSAPTFIAMPRDPSPQTEERLRSGGEHPFERLVGQLKIVIRRVVFVRVKIREERPPYPTHGDLQPLSRRILYLISVFISTGKTDKDSYPYTPYPSTAPNNHPSNHPCNRRRNREPTCQASHNRRTEPHHYNPTTGVSPLAGISTPLHGHISPHKAGENVSIGLFTI